MTEYALSVDEFIEEIKPLLEEEVDAMILAEPELENRLVLMRHRQQIVRTYVEAVRRRNLEYRLAQAEERLKPRLVET
jgi:hypothetical protein